MRAILGIFAAIAALAGAAMWIHRPASAVRGAA
jgi:hypothetical protein